MSAVKTPFGFAGTAAEDIAATTGNRQLHVAGYALDPENGRRLWALSESLLTAAR